MTWGVLPVEMFHRALISTPRPDGEPVQGGTLRVNKKAIELCHRLLALYEPLRVQVLP